MSIEVSISKKELAEFKKGLKLFRKTEANRVRTSMKYAGLEMESAAKIAAPIKTGRLRSSIHYREIDNGFAAEAYTNVEYAEAQNNGTSRIKGKFFMEKGQKAGVKKFMDKMRTAR